MLKEFKEFAIKGNVIDLAVGVIIGGAFGKIVSSLVSDIIMPLIGVLTGGIDFTTKAITLKAAANGKDAVLLKYGMFIQNVIDFFIIAFSIFLFVKAINKLKRHKEEAVEEVKEEKLSKEVELLSEIRDLLKDK